MSDWHPAFAFIAACALALAFANIAVSFLPV